MIVAADCADDAKGTIAVGLDEFLQIVADTIVAIERNSYVAMLISQLLNLPPGRQKRQQDEFSIGADVLDLLEIHQRKCDVAAGDQN